MTAQPLPDTENPPFVGMTPIEVVPGDVQSIPLDLVYQLNDPVLVDGCLVIDGRLFLGVA